MRKRMKTAGEDTESFRKSHVDFSKENERFEPL
jgi:hypothetical protein